MLYITTNDQNDAYTAYKTLISDCAADGGVYIPFRFPQYDDLQIRKLKDQSFGEVVAQILNTFFSAQLNAWDVDFAIGRNPLKLATVGRKIVVSELWHNHDGSYGCFVRNLFVRLSQNDGIAPQPTDWARVAIRIAVLFGIYAQMHQSGIITCNDTPDVVIEAGDYLESVAAYFAKQMGLPFGKIVICCDGDTAPVWDLIHRGEISTAMLNKKVSLGIARLLGAVYGKEEMNKFVNAAVGRRSYRLDEEIPQKLSDDFACVVVSKDRVPAVINSVFKTDNYHIDEKTAMSFGAVQDYRAKAGESNLTIVFSENKAVSM